MSDPPMSDVREETMTNHTREETFRLTSFARCAG